MNTQWKEYLTEERKHGDVEVGFESDGVLVYDKAARKQKYILNSIREIEGVRIVNVITPTEPYGETDRVGIRVKYTPHYKELVSYLPEDWI